VISRIGKNARMHMPIVIRRVALPIGAVLFFAGCAGGQAAGWTYAPLGPSAAPSGAAASGAAGSGAVGSGAPSSGAPASGAASSGAPGSPSGSGGAGTTITVQTTQDQPLAFNPGELTVPAGAQVTVNYTNNSNLPHNIDFFNGPDNSAPSLGATSVTTGPNAAGTLTFAAPTKPGDYFFWCDVHQSAMKGTLHVQ
jgi:plastocyanin